MGNVEFSILDVCAILDCILDDDSSSCPKLMLHIPYPSTEIFAMVMQTIAQRSPHLQELAFRFIIIGFDYKVTSPLHEKKGSLLSEDARVLFLSIFNCSNIRQ